MNFRVLKAFLAVCRFGSMTAASAHLHLSQPALSRQIAELESELDTLLFERSTRRLTLTAAGLLFEARARELVALMELTERELLEEKGAVTGLIRLGCVESSVIDFVVEEFRRTNANHPQITFELYSADGDDIRAALDRGRLDLGILLEPVEATKYDAVSLPYSDRWGVVVSENSAAAQLDAFLVEKLPELPLIVPRRWIVLDEVASWLDTEREHLNVLMYHNLPTLALRFVQKSRAAVLCVEGSYAVRPTPGLRFVPLTPERRTRHKLVRRRNVKLSKACELFWRGAQSRFAKQEENAA